MVTTQGNDPLIDNAAKGRDWFHAETADEWRSWLAANYATSTGCWLVTWKKPTGLPAPSYDAAVSEALCFGWVDSKPSKLDDARTMLYYAPRKKGSGWARPNKIRIEQMERDGKMTDAGRRLIDAAKADGSWTMLDAVEDLVVPDDLAAALSNYPSARANWDAFNRSTKRGVLEWIVQAKKPETRAARIAETARLAEINEKANQWKPNR
jgi:uncharacterized protein YdeI (YjbR/CyaY-like superfamily)